MSASLVSIRKLRCPVWPFSIRKGGSFPKVKEIKDLRGDVLLYVAQVNPQIDAEIGKNSPFRTKTSLTITGPVSSISEPRTTKKGKTFIWISVAENITKDETLWHRFFVWNKQAEQAQTHLRPGSIVEAHCHINYKNADEGPRQTIFTAYRLNYLANFGKSKSNQSDYDEDPPF